jgi:hypothetical protein
VAGASREARTTVVRILKIFLPNGPWSHASGPAGGTV